MRSIEGFMAAPTVQDRKLRTLAAQEFQTTIVGMMGHDLRQSLQVIQGTYSLLRSRLEEIPQQAWLDRGERAVTKLAEQLNCLVDAFYLAERDNALEVSFVALGPLFWQLQHENEDAAIQRGIDLRAITANVHVTSNPVLLGCILRNLLTNAIRYTEPGGRILIGCRRKGAKSGSMYTTPASVFRKTNCRESSNPSRALHPNAITAWVLGSLSFVVRSRCLATGSKCNRLWVKGRFSRSTRPQQRQARAKVPR
jgi:signal transduction histidine kinase